MQKNLCIGLSDGRVCLFNIFSSKIIRCINLGHRITALENLTSFTDSNPRYLSEELLLFNGLVAVGTQEGHVFLIDLGLDEESKLCTDENNPCQPFLTHLRGQNSEKVAQIRASAIKRGQHLCISVTQVSIHKQRGQTKSRRNVNGN